MDACALLRGQVRLTAIVLTLATASANPSASSHLDELAVLDQLYVVTNGADWDENYGWTILPCSDRDTAGKCTARSTADLCSDSIEECSLWADLGECENNPTFMHGKCSRSCDTCASQLEIALDPCKRLMVGCNEGRVAALSMRNNNIAGTLPTELGRLTALETIHIFSNFLSGTLPTQIGSLRSLDILSVYANPLSGAVPSQIGNLHGLTRFVASNNELSTLPTEIGFLTKLQVLNLYSTAITEGNLPTQLAQLRGVAPLVGDPPSTERNVGREFFAAMKSGAKEEL